MTSRLNVLVLATLGLLLLTPETSRAELPPGTYEQLKKEAPEVLLLHITSVKPKKIQDPISQYFVCKAEIVKVERSKAGHKAGESIGFTSYFVTRDALRRGFAGPKSPPLLKAGWEGRVYLAPDRGVEKGYTPAAYGKSFVRMSLKRFRVSDSATPKSTAGDLVVRVASAPLRAGPSVVAHAKRGTTLTVNKTQGSWLLVRHRNQWVWIHKNHVAKADAPSKIGEQAVPIANLMQTPILGSSNPFLYFRLGSAATSLVASGREQELIDAEEKMLAMVNIARGAMGLGMKTKLYGILGGIHISRGNTGRGTRYLNLGFNLAEQTVKGIESGQIQEPRGSGLKPIMIHAMAACGWQQANAGQLRDGEEKLAVAAAAVDRALPLKKLLEDDEFTTVIDSRIYTWHADVLIRLHRVEEARSQMVKAEKCGQAYTRWATHPMTFVSVDSSGYGGYPESLMALCMVHQGEVENALRKTDEAQRLRHRYEIWWGHVDDAILELVVRETRGSFIGDNFVQDPFDFAMAFAGLPNSLPEMPRLSAEWVINRKFKFQENLERQATIIRDNEGSGPSKMPDSSLSVFGVSFGDYATLDRIREMRGLAADYALRTFAAKDLDDAKREFETLRHVGSALRSTRLRSMSGVPDNVRKAYSLAVSPTLKSDGTFEKGDSRALKNWHDDQARRTWVDAPTVQESLNENQVLIEFVRYDDFDYASLDTHYRWLPSRYAAWIIPADGDVVRIDLGRAEAIERAIDRLRDGIQAAAGEQGTIRSLGEPQAVAELMSKMGDFTKLVIDPLRPYLKSAKELVISPDGELWLVPWAALPWKKDQFFVERFNLRTVTTGREVVRIDQTRIDKEERDVTAPIIIADPDFAMSSDQVLATERATLEHELASSPVIVARRGMTLIPETVTPLPYTKIEAELIAPSLEKYTGTKPNTFLQDKAIEALFEKIKRPQVLVLSTHGFFLPAKSNHGDRERLDIRDPMMRCGLMLAGCNQHDRWETRRACDGILTGYEVCGLDLRGTELVVLSACDTGVGEVRSAEGIMGLRQAFQTAGAKAVLASLWQVPDRETAIIMSAFFERLAAGQTKADAFRDAQLARIAARRKTSGAAHPYLWGAFTLTGH